MDNIYYAKGNMQFTRQASISDTIGLGERPEIVLLIDPIAYTPEALCAWNHRHRIQVISPHKRTGAGHHTPARAIPLQGEGIGQVLAVPEISHRPDSIGGQGSHTRKHTSTSESWTWDCTPCVAVPMLGEWLRACRIT